MSRADGADAPYWNGLEEGKLTLPRCDGCDRWIWPAGHRCGACGTTGVHWVERPMAATVFSWTRTWHAFGGAESLGLPFTTVLAEIEDCGIRLLGRLDDPDRIDPILGEKLTGQIGRTQAGDDSIPTIIWSRAA
ncbi:zinc ribbon domain-containing protein [Sphingomonas sp. IC-11]|uniref:Zn-ribbon domain-containing OB-fold protein n=1 Tax=Sphingomonas sp. IC-11 TaxID=2898528 RepID=UPI001E4ECE22|nr:zinc ribbon domain-containing protein [Sphingomonas sp. IC-11]MCD2316270.1 zinc ribbon domain-containing protein [Sphingomonas sp. IC-11]